MSVDGVRQLRRIILNYCNWGGSSQNIRSFVASPRLIQFAEANPSVEVIVKKRAGHPFIIGEYVNGVQHQIDVKNKPETEIVTVMHQLRNRSGRKTSTLKFWQRPRTSLRSIQGLWKPLVSNSANL